MVPKIDNQTCSTKEYGSNFQSSLSCGGEFYDPDFMNMNQFG